MIRAYIHGSFKKHVRRWWIAFFILLSSGYHKILSLQVESAIFANGSQVKFWCFCLFQFLLFLVHIEIYLSFSSLWYNCLCLVSDGVLVCCWYRGNGKEPERKREREWCSGAWAGTNYRGFVSMQLRRMWEDFLRCQCLEKAFPHPWRKAVCLRCRRMWEGTNAIP